MPPPIPDRFRLEVRLGRDGDIEEWLASDTSLDRPVLIRALGPESSPERRRQFVEAVRSAAGVNHPHLAAVFAADEIPDGAYAVSEWTGGMTLRDRLGSGETVDVHEFLPNAAGLASALAALHAEGAVHSAIDAGAVFYTVAHPAKLASFGRPPRDRTAIEDVRALARTLEEALTGAAAGGPPPSEVVDGLSPAVDAALRRARVGLVTAKALSDELTASPSPVAAAQEPPGWSRRLLLSAGALVVAAVGLVALGRLFLVDTATPIALPQTTAPGATIAVPTTSTIPPVVSGDPQISQALAVTGVATVDPFGGGDENDDRLPNLLDGDPATVWRSETYLDPLPLLKPGVGIAFAVASAPRFFEAAGITPGVHYVLAWTPETPPDPLAWDAVAVGSVMGDSIALQLPARDDGRWVLWLTDLPADGEGNHSAQIAEVRFRT